jgi:ectoine hydroxylase-related dioxygenase (phytanoyl-CoA dioxygenase family)
MLFNTVPNRAITQADKDAYARDGVVCLKNVFDPKWIESLVPMARRITIDEEDVGLLPSAPGRYMSRIIPEFRRFVFQSPMAQAAAETIGSSQARFFFDEMFAKAPESDSKTIWHCDRMGWPVSGDMVPSLWIPLNPVSTENCLEVLAGSQNQDIPYWLFSPNARKMIKPKDREAHPNEKVLRENDKDKFLSWEMEVGDMLVLHPWVLHYSSGNTSSDWRIALSVRVFGDDIVWDPRPDCVNLAGVSFDEMVEGCAPEGPCFPLLWSHDNQRDGDKDFPMGFATSWNKTRRTAVNEDKLFSQLSKEIT